MNRVVNFLNVIVGTMDRHEGMVAMLGIIVTILIFVREVSKNYFTMEQDNFKDIFKDLALKKLPEKIDSVEQAKESEWGEKFKDLMDVLDTILIEAKYYKYSIPFFYECLRLRIDEIRDLERHENWRLYRNGVKQNALIQKKCRAIIRNINNASKGKVFSIKVYQNRLIQKMRSFFVKNLYDRPADRITEKYLNKDIGDFTFETISGCIPDKPSLKKLSADELIIKANAPIYIYDVKCVKSGDIYFGYAWNIRWGNYVGKTVIKAKGDGNVTIRQDRNQVTLELKDNDVHKVVLMWIEKTDKSHIYFNKFNIRKSNSV